MHNNYNKYHNQDLGLMLYQLKKRITKGGYRRVRKKIPTGEQYFSFKVKERNFATLLDLALK